MTTFKSARHPDEITAAAASARRNVLAKAARQRQADHAAAIRENHVRNQAASLGVDFDAFMAETVR